MSLTWTILLFLCLASRVGEGLSLKSRPLALTTNFFDCFASNVGSSNTPLTLKITSFTVSPFFTLNFFLMFFTFCLGLRYNWLGLYNLEFSSWFSSTSPWWVELQIRVATVLQASNQSNQAKPDKRKNFLTPVYRSKLKTLFAIALITSCYQTLVSV